MTSTSVSNLSMKKKDMIFVIKDNLKIYIKTAIFV